MRHYDYTVNVKWVMAHYNAAGKYLGRKSKDLKQQEDLVGVNTCIQNTKDEYSYPYLWSEEELKNWGTF